jgi:hypothetical protein
MRYVDVGWLSIALIIAGLAVWNAAYRRLAAEALANPAPFLTLHWWIPGLRTSDFQSRRAWQSAWIARVLIWTGLLINILRLLRHS